VRVRAAMQSDDDINRAMPPTFAARISGSADRERARFFLWSPVALGFGIAAYFALPEEPTLWFAFLPLVLALVIKQLTPSGSLRSALATVLILSATGFVLAKARVEFVRAPVLQKPLNNVELVGTITRVEPRPPRGMRLTLRVAELSGVPESQRPHIARVRVLSGNVTLMPGDRVRLKASLAPPAKPALPGGFDFARAAWFDRLGAVGYSYATPVREPLVDPPTFRDRVMVAIEGVRHAISARIRSVLPGETGAIAAALITGERGGISSQTNDAYRSSGLFHILSISGLHMVIMAGAVFFSVRLLLASIPAIALRYPIKKWAAVAGMVAALGYLAISGGAFATVRSALMILVIFGAVLLDRPALALRNVALSAFIILTLYPESLFDAGFQMSFAAVTGLVATYEEVRRRMGRGASQRGEPHPVLRVLLFFGGIVFSTLIASIAVAPFAAYHFHQSQQYAVLANLIAIPICNLVVMPSALAALVLMPIGLERFALWPMGMGIEAMSWCARLVADLPGAVGHLPAIPQAAFVMMVLGGLWLALWQTRMRVIGIAMVLIGIAMAPFMARPDILIARNGELIALRGPDGLLSALPARQSKYELERWLEHDGDARKASDVQSAAAFWCDGIGCLADVKGARVAVARHPAALRDDCALATVVVMRVPRPAYCGQDAPAALRGDDRTGAQATVEPLVDDRSQHQSDQQNEALDGARDDENRPQAFEGADQATQWPHNAAGSDAPASKAWATTGPTVIDVFDVWRDGTHALYIQNSGAKGGMPQIRVDTVAAHRGDRPWAPRIAKRERGVNRSGPTRSSPRPPLDTDVRGDGNSSQGPRQAQSNSADNDNTLGASPHRDASDPPALPHFAGRPEWLRRDAPRAEIEDEDDFHVPEDVPDEPQ
jgi:competence protein ComEC